MVQDMGNTRIRNKWLNVIIVLILLFLISSFSASLLMKGSISLEDKIAVVRIYGPISLDSSSSSIIPSSSVSSQQILDDIAKIKKDSSIKGIIFEINSPGGTVVASEEIAHAIQELNITKYAVIREVGASGGYWIASATDKIIASPMSITGSIGVISSYLEFSNLFEKYGVNYQRLVSGDLKDMGSPYKDLTPKEQVKMQSKLNNIHDYFIEEVARNRKLEVSKVRQLATGEFYLGKEAKELGLIDEFGTKENAIGMMKKELGITDAKIVEYKHEKSVFDLFTKMSAYYIGIGIGESLANQKISNDISLQV